MPAIAGILILMTRLAYHAFASLLCIGYDAIINL